jgi:putative flippase GtrA
MPAPRGKLTDLPELVAYVLAHAAGLAWAYAVNPMIFRSLVAQGYRDHLVLAAFALGIAASVVVLLLFLLLRKAVAGTGAPPPPADRPAPPPKFTDLRELSAYVLAHAAGMAWGFIVNPLIFRSLIAQGIRYLMPIGLAISIALSIVVLLLFLFLRKAMAGPGQPT